MPTDLPTKITYWLPTGNNGTGGKTWATPVTINGRIAEVAEEFFEDEGKKVWANKAVYALTRIPTGGYIIEGIYSDASPVAGAQKVCKVSSNPTFTNYNRMLLQ